MSGDKFSYRQIIKATSIFGGVQVFQIVIGIVRSKFIAIFLGPLGMGISGLLQSGTEMIAAMTNLGLSTSAVKHVSESHSSESRDELFRTISVVRRVVWFTGFLGFFIMLLASPYLSQFIFGNRDYTWSFALLSLTLLINQLSEGYGVILRGMREIKFMAKASMIGSLIGLFTTLPLYYFFGNQGIVPAIIVAAITSLLLNWHFVLKLPLDTIPISWGFAFEKGKKMIYLGLMVSIAALITIAFSNLVRIYISNYGSLEDVGFYNAGFTLINTYVGMIFTAMSMDYFPRLSEVASDITKANKAINQQAEISLLILSPVILIFIVFSKWVIYILFSKAFLPIQEMVLFAAFGTLFKAISWAFAFLVLAKGNNKVFLFNELIANIYFLPINLFGYHSFGLKGLGLSYIISYLIYSIQTFILLKSKYDFVITSGLIKIFGIQVILAACSLCSTYFFDEIKSLVIGIFLIIVSAFYSSISLKRKLAY